jgi:hemerythrin HHE cation binding domain-containing protein
MVTAAGRPIQTFQTIFREEHRVVRDLLLALVDALEARDLERARTLLQQVAATAGPHFRYEEEALYPALVPIFGAGYIEKLVGDHDFAIASARRLAVVAAQNTLTDDEAAEAIRLVRGILPHVSDCEGLTIMAELFSDSVVESVLETREAAREAGLDLLAWAAEVRTRRAPSHTGGSLRTTESGH